MSSIGVLSAGAAEITTPPALDDDDASGHHHASGTPSTPQPEPSDKVANTAVPSSSADTVNTDISDAKDARLVRSMSDESIAPSPGRAYRWQTYVWQQPQGEYTVQVGGLVSQDTGFDLAIQHRASGEWFSVHITQKSLLRQDTFLRLSVFRQLLMTALDGHEPDDERTSIELMVEPQTGGLAESIPLQAAAVDSNEKSMGSEEKGVSPQGGTENGAATAGSSINGDGGDMPDSKLPAGDNDNSQPAGSLTVPATHATSLNMFLSVRTPLIQESATVCLTAGRACLPTSVASVPGSRRGSVASLASPSAKATANSANESTRSGSSLEAPPDDKVELEGWLSKKSSSFFGGWQDRYFRATSLDLTYYSDDTNREVLGKVPFDKWHFEGIHVPSAGSRQLFSISVRLIAGPAKLHQRKFSLLGAPTGFRVMHLKARTEDDATGWVDFFQRVESRCSENLPLQFQFPDSTQFLRPSASGDSTVDDDKSSASSNADTEVASEHTVDTESEVKEPLAATTNGVLAAASTVATEDEKTSVDVSTDDEKSLTTARSHKSTSTLQLSAPLLEFQDKQRLAFHEAYDMAVQELGEVAPQDVKQHPPAPEDELWKQARRALVAPAHYPFFIWIHICPFMRALVGYLASEEAEDRRRSKAVRGHHHRLSFSLASGDIALKDPVPRSGSTEEEVSEVVAQVGTLYAGQSRSHLFSSSITKLTPVGTPRTPQKGNSDDQKDNTSQGASKAATPKASRAASPVVSCGAATEDAASQVSQSGKATSTPSESHKNVVKHSNSGTPKDSTSAVGGDHALAGPTDANNNAQDEKKENEMQQEDGDEEEEEESPSADQKHDEHDDSVTIAERESFLAIRPELRNGRREHGMGNRAVSLFELASAQDTVKRPSCSMCNARFSLARHRHMCHRCGQVVCSRCAPKNNARPIHDYGIIKPKRHCLRCLPLVGAFGSRPDTRVVAAAKAGSQPKSYASPGEYLQRHTRLEAQVSWAPLSVDPSDDGATSLPGSPEKPRRLRNASVSTGSIINVSPTGGSGGTASSTFKIRLGFMPKAHVDPRTRRVIHRVGAALAVCRSEEDFIWLHKALVAAYSEKHIPRSPLGIKSDNKMKAWIDSLAGKHRKSTGTQLLQDLTVYLNAILRHPLLRESHLVKVFFESHSHTFLSTKRRHSTTSETADFYRETSLDHWVLVKVRESTRAKLARLLRERPAERQQRLERGMERKGRHYQRVNQHNHRKAQCEKRWQDMQDMMAKQNERMETARQRLDMQRDNPQLQFFPWDHDQVQLDAEHSARQQGIMAMQQHVVELRMSTQQAQQDATAFERDAIEAFSCSFNWHLHFRLWLASLLLGAMEDESLGPTSANGPAGQARSVDKERSMAHIRATFGVHIENEAKRSELAKLYEEWVLAQDERKLLDQDMKRLSEEEHHREAEEERMQADKRVRDEEQALVAKKKSHITADLTRAEAALQELVEYQYDDLRNDVQTIQTSLEQVASGLALREKTCDERVGGLEVRATHVEERINRWTKRVQQQRNSTRVLNLPVDEEEKKERAADEKTLQGERSVLLDHLGDVEEGLRANQGKAQLMHDGLSELSFNQTKLLELLPCTPTPHEQNFEQIQLTEPGYDFAHSVLIRRQSMRQRAQEHQTELEELKAGFAKNLDALGKEQFALTEQLAKLMLQRKKFDAQAELFAKESELMATEKTLCDDRKQQLLSPLENAKRDCDLYRQQLTDIAERQASRASTRQELSDVTHSHEVCTGPRRKRHRERLKNLKKRVDRFESLLVLVRQSTQLMHIKSVDTDVEQSERESALNELKEHVEFGNKATETLEHQKKSVQEEEKALKAMATSLSELNSVLTQFDYHKAAPQPNEDLDFKAHITALYDESVELLRAVEEQHKAVQTVCSKEVLGVAEVTSVVYAHVEGLRDESKSTQEEQTLVDREEHIIADLDQERASKEEQLSNELSHLQQAVQRWTNAVDSLSQKVAGRQPLVQDVVRASRALDVATLAREAEERRELEAKLQARPPPFKPADFQELESYSESHKVQLEKTCPGAQRVLVDVLQKLKACQTTATDDLESARSTLADLLSEEEAYNGSMLRLQRFNHDPANSVDESVTEVDSNEPGAKEPEDYVLVHLLQQRDTCRKEMERIRTQVEATCAELETEVKVSLPETLREITALDHAVNEEHHRLNEETETLRSLKMLLEKNHMPLCPRCKGLGGITGAGRSRKGSNCRNCDGSGASLRQDACATCGGKGGLAADGSPVWDTQDEFIRGCDSCDGHGYVDGDQ